MRQQRRKPRKKAAERGQQSVAALVLAGQAVVLAKLVLVVTVFDPFATDTFTLPKSAISHSLAFVLAALVAGAVITRTSGPRGITLLDIGVFATFAGFVLASVWPVDQTLAFFGAPRRFLGLTHQADLLVTYLGARVFFSERDDWKRLLTVGLATTVPVVVYAFVQRFGLDPIHYDLDTHRPISTLGNQDITGGYLGIAWAAAFGLAFVFWAELRPPGRIVVLTISMACAIAMIFVEIRAGVLAASAGWLAAMAISWTRRSQRSNRRRTAWAAAATVLAAGAIVASPLGARFDISRWGADLAVLGRLEIWRTAIRAVAARPILGLGPDNFVAVYPSVREEQSVLINGPDVFQNSTHDLLLSALTSSGLVGTTVFLALLVVTAISVQRAARSGDVRAFVGVPFAAYLAQGIVNVNDVALDWIPYVCIAVLAAFSPALWVLPTRRAASIERWVIVGGVVAASLWLAVLPLSRIGASESEFRARLFMDKRPLEAVGPAQQAIALDSRRGGYWSTFGTALAAAGNQSAAISAFQEAVSREPWQALYWRDIGIARISSGDRSGALVALGRAVELDRYDVFALDLLARVSFNVGDYEAASSYGARAAHAYPPRPESYEALVAADIQLQRPEHAEAALLRGLSMVQPAVLRILLAKTYIAEGRTADAEQQLDLVLAVEPGNAAALALKHEISP